MQKVKLRIEIDELTEGFVLRVLQIPERPDRDRYEDKSEKFAFSTLEEVTEKLLDLRDEKESR